MIDFERRGIVLGALLATIVLVIIGLLLGVGGDDSSEPTSAAATACALLGAEATQRLQLQSGWVQGRSSRL